MYAPMMADRRKSPGAPEEKNPPTDNSSVAAPPTHTLTYSKDVAPRNGPPPGDSEQSGDTRTSAETAAKAPRDRTSGSAGASELQHETVGRYRLLEEHGRGGLGRVLRATDVELDREVAFKELRSASNHARERFLREAKITARLQHPAIVPIHELAARPDGKPYYTMKLIRGRSLRAEIKRTNSLAERLALIPKLQAVADAMDYAHSHRVIHRDLKPANIVCGTFGETVVIDWGLAKELGHDDGAPRGEGPYRDPRNVDLTLEGSVMGTPAYMPPEQARGEPVDERADVYALGAILYHIVSGDTPYTRTKGSSVVLRVLDGPPQQLRDLAPQAPPDIVAIVERAMARDPNNRYGTAKQFAADLRSYLTGGLVGARTYTTRELVVRWLRNHKAIAISASVAVAATAIIGGFSINRVINEREAATRARAAAVDRTNELILSKARDALDRDPTEAVAWLKSYPEDGKNWVIVQHIAADAQSRGIARHVMRGHQGAIRHVAISKDGRRAATYGADSNVWLWDLVRGKGTKLGEKIHWDGSKISFAPNGSHVAVGTDTGDIVLLPTTGGPATRLKGHHGMVWHLQHTENGKQLLSSGADKTVRLWNLNGHSSQILASEDLAVLLPRLSPNHQFLALCESRLHLYLIRLADGSRRRLGDCVPGNAYAYPLVFSRDSRLLAAGSASGAVLLWDLGSETGRTFHLGAGIVHDVQLSPRGNWLAAAGDGTGARLWNLKTGGLVKSISSCEILVAFSEDGRFFACAGKSGDVALRDLIGGGHWTFRGQRGLTMGLRFLPGGKGIVSAGYGGDVRVWPMPATVPRVLARHKRRVREMLYSPNGQWIATGGRDGYVLLSSSSGRRHSARSKFDTAASTIAFSSDGELLAVGDGAGGVYVWQVRGGKRVHLGSHSEAIMSVAFSPDAQYVLSAGLEGELWLWSVSGGANRRLASGTPLQTAVFSADGASIASGDAEGNVRVYSLTGGRTRPLTTGHEALVYVVAFSSDGRHLASVSGDGTTRLWNLETGQARIVSRGSGGSRALVWVSKDSFASAGADGVIVLGSTAHAKVSRIRGHPAEVWSLDAFAGRLLASAGDDGTVRLWWLGTQRSAVLRGAGQGFTSIALSPDGRFVAAVDKQGRLLQWTISGVSSPPIDPRSLRHWLRGVTSVAAITD